MADNGFRGLRITNTLTRRKEDFVPADPDNVRMYVCGPTVYDYAHIGNARPAIVFDVLFRLLRHLYGPQHVTYVRNITDVDDKINARALRDFGAEIDAGRMTYEVARHRREKFTLYNKEWDEIDEVAENGAILVMNSFFKCDFDYKDCEVSFKLSSIN